MEYLLNFRIPQGPTGPALNNLASYGGKYSNTAQSLNLNAGTATQIPLANTMPSLNVTNTTANTIVVNQAGIYEINYSTNLTAAVASTITLGVRANGTNIPSTVLSRALTVGTNTIYSGSVIVSLNANTSLDLAFTASIAVGLNLGSGVNATLSVKKLNNL